VQPRQEEDALGYNPSARTSDVNADNVITATLTFNDEWVDAAANPPEKIYYPFTEQSGYNVINEDIEGESYEVYVPRYGCVVTRFFTKKKI